MNNTDYMDWRRVDQVYNGLTSSGFTLVRLAGGFLFEAQAGGVDRQAGGVLAIFANLDQEHGYGQAATIEFGGRSLL
jgi:hypothetical protein